MYIKRLKIKDFRNYDTAELYFSDKTNIIYGNNAQGKTNILESIFVYCSGRSHRRADDGEMIREGALRSIIEVEFCDENRDYYGKMIMQSGKKKLVSFNGVSLTKISQIANYINAVIFSPEDLNIVKGSPGERRRFMDMALSQLKPNYVSVLNDYLKVLKQRNNLLKKLNPNSAEADTLDIWDESLADLGAKITIYRKDFIDFLKPFVLNTYAELSNEKLDLNYISNFTQSFDNYDVIKENMLNLVKKNRRRDIETKISNIGVHRDDILFSIDGRDLKIYGSQGQHRSVVLCMKIAQTEAVYSVKKTYPIILLDDIMSELDKNRRDYFAGKIKDKQVIITCTDRDNTQKDAKYFYVKSGNVKAEY